MHTRVINSNKFRYPQRGFNGVEQTVRHANTPIFNKTLYKKAPKSFKSRKYTLQRQNGCVNRVTLNYVVTIVIFNN